LGEKVRAAIGAKFLRPDDPNFPIAPITSTP
jgi:hypothetical protein